VNNLFGEWTWDEENGVIPRYRHQDATHYVRRFDSLRQSVNSYLHNLNSGHAYDTLRALRAKMRSEGEVLDPVRLAAGLENYSARGSEYVQEIQTMIRSNGLNKLGPLDLLH
jgi:Bax protein